MIVSGRMRARTPEEDTNVCRVEAYFGTDAGLFDDHWPVSHVGVASPPPVIFMPLHHQTSVMAHMKTADQRRVRQASPSQGQPRAWSFDHEEKTSMRARNCSNWAMSMPISGVNF